MRDSPSLKGEGVTVAQCGIQSTFLVQLRDRYGNKTDVIPGHHTPGVSAQILRDEENVLPCDIKVFGYQLITRKNICIFSYSHYLLLKEREPGVYEACYIPTKSGPYYLNVTVDEVQIKDSPYTVQIDAGNETTDHVNCCTNLLPPLQVSQQRKA